MFLIDGVPWVIPVISKVLHLVSSLLGFNAVVYLYNICKNVLSIMWLYVQSWASPNFLKLVTSFSSYKRFTTCVNYKLTPLSFRAYFTSRSVVGKSLSWPGTDGLAASWSAYELVRTNLILSAFRALVECIIRFYLNDLVILKSPCWYYVSQTLSSTGGAALWYLKESERDMSVSSCVLPCSLKLL